MDEIQLWISKIPVDGEHILDRWASTQRQSGIKLGKPDIVKTIEETEYLL